MANRFMHKLSLGKRVVLASAAIIAIAGPITIGLMNAPRGRAQSQAARVMAPASTVPEAKATATESGATAAAPAPQVPAERAAAPEKKLAFEVASVKRAERCEFGRTIDAGSVSLKGMPLKPILVTAFGMRADQIEGPSWLESDCFDISAKLPAGASLDQLPDMLLALLTERFRLAAHKEDRPRSGYALVVDKGGPKFKEDAPNSNFARSPDGRQIYYFGAAGHGALKAVWTMASLAGYLSGRGYGPVQDSTGLTGKYDIDLSWAPNLDFEPRPLGPTPSADTPPGADIPAPEADLFAALRESLGLRLERRNIPAQFVVIDHIERVPTEN
jgi:uncharacterized protein (TIGR03435 family)